MAEYEEERFCKPWRHPRKRHLAGWHWWDVFAVLVIYEKNVAEAYHRRSAISRPGRITRKRNATTDSVACWRGRHIGVDEVLGRDLLVALTPRTDRTWRWPRRSTTWMRWRSAQMRYLGGLGNVRGWDISTASATSGFRTILDYPATLVYRTKPAYSKQSLKAWILAINMPGPLLAHFKILQTKSGISSSRAKRADNEAIGRLFGGGTSCESKKHTL